jgi:putative ATPase
MEDGTIVLVGATTENPSSSSTRHSCRAPRVLVFKSLDDEAIGKLLIRAEEIEGKTLPLDADARPRSCAWPTVTAARRSPSWKRSGARRARARFSTPPLCRTSCKGARRSTTSRRTAITISSRPCTSPYALRSGRGALLSRRMLDAGEDPLYLARRVVRMAVEDIGLADPQALVICNAAKDAYDFLGSPEGELAIAQAVIYVATAPKSNAPTRPSARPCARQGAGSLLPPKHILNAPTS